MVIETALDLLKAALPYVERVASTCPTEPARQRRRDEAVRLRRQIEACLAEAA